MSIGVHIELVENRKWYNPDNNGWHNLSGLFCGHPWGTFPNKGEKDPIRTFTKWLIVFAPGPTTTKPQKCPSARWWPHLDWGGGSLACCMFYRMFYGMPHHGFGLPEVSPNLEVLDFQNFKWQGPGICHVISFIILFSELDAFNMCNRSCDVYQDILPHSL